jgi:hypothetical protein
MFLHRNKHRFYSSLGFERLKILTKMKSFDHSTLESNIFLNFSSNKELQMNYTNFLGGIRVGLLFEGKS